MGKANFLHEIKKMDSTELDVILQAVEERYRVLFPDWGTYHGLTESRRTFLRHEEADYGKHL